MKDKMTNEEIKWMDQAFIWESACKAVQHRMHLTAFGAFCGGVGVGGLFTLVVVLVQIGGW